ncbi:hypothetical protein B0H14DRAFT_2611444 [Mycena olivaceomarginata]|nr:hypothetical protein B0H14DRAFT_2611444 [Mycena olivaceomarginata]
MVVELWSHGWRQDDGVIGTCPPKSLKNAISGQGFGNFGLKNAKFGQGNGQISVSKTQIFGQPFGGAFQGLTQCASLHFTAHQPWNENPGATRSSSPFSANSGG